MDFSNKFNTTAERFIRYAKIDTQADPESKTSPSSEKQKVLSRLLFQELNSAGIKAECDEYGYVYAWIPPNSPNPGPRIFFCAHVDTAPDCSGTNVLPILHQNYKGQALQLPDDPEITISSEDFPQLATKIGEDIITASGQTLLGADDKAGVCAIMEAALYINNHSDILHHGMSILFTTDEEIGKGVDFVNVEKVNADFGYTLDGGELGSLEDETFSADACTILIKGVSTHPGYAKNKMENAIKIASEIVSLLPKDRLSPESTEGVSGFVHPTKISGGLESAEIDFIIRDFDTAMLSKHLSEIENICNRVLSNYPASTIHIQRREQYRNMKEILVAKPEIVELAERAIKEAGIPIKKGRIRGGTDGSRLSFMGLPCPNLFAGEHGIHSKKEWVSVQDIKKAAEVIVRIIMSKN
ncbi:MAG: peptidase T [Saprospiraceae bacterium]|nr:peptidase T [Saprospiraceae bacterium]